MAYFTIIRKVKLIRFYSTRYSMHNMLKNIYFYIKMGKCPILKSKNLKKINKRNDSDREIKFLLCIVAIKIGILYITHCRGIKRNSTSFC